MASDNSVTVVGNLVDDPDLRFTSGGQAMARLRLANSRRWQDRASGEWKEESSFFTVTAWRDLADNASQSLRKGMRVIVTGRLQQRSWETPEGDKRSVVEIVADEIGPSLRWATVDVSRNPRREGGPADGGRQGGGGAAPAPAPAGDDEPWADEPAF
jgi:single-strand DNA-binding protein